MIPVGWLPPGDQWDTSLISDLLNNKLYPTGLEFEHHEGFPRTTGCVLVVPGRYHLATDQILEEIQRYEWVLLVRTSDEEDLFPFGEIVHQNLKWWVQTPRGDRDYGDARLIGVGYSPHFASLPTDPPVKDLDVFLAAQKSNALTGRHFKVYERRTAFFKALKRGAWVKNLIERDGFAQGDRAEYVAGMLSAKVAPAPTGMVSVDSFRFWEALAAHCVPLADTVSDADGVTDYWQRLFGDSAPFPEVEDCDDLPGLVDDELAAWPASANRITAWWMRYKRSLAMGLREDLQALGAL